jgi:hypothetical protein
MEFKAAICPNCGADLRLPEDGKVLKCMYCGKDIVVQEAIIKAVPTVESLLKLARTAKEAKNYEEAYSYYNKVLELDSSNFESWLGKAESAAWQSSIDNFRVQELVTNFEKAMTCCPQETKGPLISKGIADLNVVLVAMYKHISKYMYEGGKLPQVRNAYYNRCQLLVSAWEVLNKYDPNNKQIIDNIIDVCQSQIEGVEYNPAPGQHPIFKTYSNITPEYKSTLNSKITLYVSKRSALDPSYIRPIPKKKSWLNL